MSIYIGQHKAEAIRLGETVIRRSYLGNAKVYQYDMAVAASLAGCTAELPSKILYGEALTAALTPSTGRRMLPWNTRVLMGGEDITSTAYDSTTHAISIPRVTGDIQIEAEAVELSNDYLPLEYIYLYSNNNGARLQIGYPATHNTEFEFELHLNGSGGCLISHAGHTTTGSGGTTPDFTYRPNYTSSQTGFSIKRGSTAYSSTSRTIPKTHRCKVVVGKTLVVDGSSPYDIDDGTEFETPNPVILLGSSSGSSGKSLGRHYRIIRRENGVKMNDYIPVRIAATGNLGWYDVVSQELKGDYPPSYYLAPFVAVTRNLAGCAATLLSGAITGTSTQAVIGSTWQVKITPSSGYTFEGGTPPQVEIGGVDVSSQVVTDNGDGTYTVTITNVEDKPVEISAAAVADPNAVQTSQATPNVTPTGGTDIPEQEDM